MNHLPRAVYALKKIRRIRCHSLRRGIVGEHGQLLAATHISRIAFDSQTDVSRGDAHTAFDGENLRPALTYGFPTNQHVPTRMGTFHSIGVQP